MSRHFKDFGASNFGQLFSQLSDNIRSNAEQLVSAALTGEASCRPDPSGQRGTGHPESESSASPSPRRSSARPSSSTSSSQATTPDEIVGNLFSQVFLGSDILFISFSFFPTFLFLCACHKKCVGRNHVKVFCSSFLVLTNISFKDCQMNIWRFKFYLIWLHSFVFICALFCSLTLSFNTHLRCARCAFAHSVELTCAQKSGRIPLSCSLNV